MEHTYISLGGGCDVAMNLNAIGFRKKSYPFDWLWNLDSGLTSVTNIIRHDFSEVLKEGAYRNTKHYRFSSNVITYEHYPSIAHIHTDPLNNIDEHEKLCRRSLSFIQKLNDTSIKHFVYYRSFNEGSFKDSTLSCQDSFNILVSEGTRFLDMLYKKFPNSKSKVTLLLVLQVDPANYATAKKLTREFRSTKLANEYPCIRVGCTYTRDDKNSYLVARWKMQWLNLLLNQTETPIRYRLLKCSAYAFRSVSRLLSKLFRKTICEKR
ncbi:DUF1796 family putative cysteine peptidase [Vibrio aestuarianus]|uniref:Papain-like cysteine peptidase n=1 Tax=Vibrio aestuarianus TaxID=28171 RepID=A0A9X4IQJ9_9VIBR|nr:DUF1796 family putative cysteine peptidase [Vibrio aestuarianus]MDE1234346.1 papain-like cysteine peptidase [Vibrio aestuarianus]MDE1243132.1 papain-like cysteine peptidase [Vibrio aestuarianus]MDE1245208.1 papain-like cysteine peptidase [Vibrio aestuarianus]NGZ64417.1 hypothetical protein [Vibrio aestuarianus subsp. cardii]